MKKSTDPASVFVTLSYSELFALAITKSMKHSFKNVFTGYLIEESYLEGCFAMMIFRFQINRICLCPVEREINMG